MQTGDWCMSSSHTTQLGILPHPHTCHVSEAPHPPMQARMEPLGIIVFSSIMGTAGVSIIWEGIAQLAAKTMPDLPHVQVVVCECSAVQVVVCECALHCCWACSVHTMRPCML